MVRHNRDLECANAGRIKVNFSSLDVLIWRTARTSQRNDVTSRLHSLTRRVVRKRGNYPETNFRQVAGLVTGSRLVGNWCGTWNKLQTLRRPSLEAANGRQLQTPARGCQFYPRSTLGT